MESLQQESTQKKSIPFIFRLPKAWLIAFISDWLPNQELAILDTAVTNHEYREHFLSCLRQLNPEKHWSVNNLSLQWISLRQVSVHSIEFNCDVTKTQAISNLYLPLLVSLEVDFQKGDENVDQAILYLVRNSPEIQSVKLQSKSEITDAGVRHIADFCPLLKDFSFCPCDTAASVTILSLLYLFRSCSLLENVSFTRGILDKYSGADLHQLKEFAHLFDSLSLLNAPDEDRIINYKDIISLLALCSKLTELDYGSAGSLDDSKILQRLGEMCPMIEKFTYTKISFFGDEEEDGELMPTSGVVPITMYLNAFRRCSHLREISLHGDVMRHFTDSDFIGLEEFGHLITMLGLQSQREDSQLTSQGFSSFIGHCPQLTSLLCAGIDEGDAVLLNRLGDSCPQLRSAMLFELMNVTDDSLIALIQGCPMLNAIKITSKPSLNIPTDAIFAHRFSPMLIDIDFRFEGALWNEMTVATCFSHCHELEVFNVQWGESIGDYAGSSLADSGLAVLASGCPKLREITLCSSPLLSIDGLLHLGETCSLMTQVYIQECLAKEGGQERFPYEEMKIIRQRFPAMKIRVSVNSTGVMPEDGEEDGEEDDDDEEEEEEEEDV